MIIFAMFLCMPVREVVYCQPQLLGSGAIFYSQQECEQAALKQFDSRDGQVVNGRVTVSWNEAAWIECRHRHVDVWEQQP